MDIKSSDKISPTDDGQNLSYLKSSGCKVGLLINFNVKLLKNGIKRFVNGSLDRIFLGDLRGENLKLLPRSFYNRPTLTVARELIGARLVRILDGHKLVGLITETEAYISQEDLACHAKAGITPRTQVMFGEPGHAYVYFTYGNHWMLNVVTEREGFPAAVLIRAIQPMEGVDIMLERRNGRDTFGPGKLCQAMGITKTENGVDLTTKTNGLWIEAGVKVPNSLVTKGPRVGLNNTPEPWLSKPWRFLVKGHIIASRFLAKQSPSQ